MDNLTVDGKTKNMVELMNKLGLTRNTLFVTKANDELLMRATANIANADVTTANLLNVYDIVVSNKLVLTVDAIKSIEEAYEK